jgi:hypothetical protein
MLALLGSYEVEDYVISKNMKRRDLFEEIGVDEKTILK